MTEGQRAALDQLEEIAASSDGALEVLRVDEGPAFLEIEISVYCGGMPRRDAGLPLHERERLIVYTPEDFPFDYPRLKTAHQRFADFPHVQFKNNLCLYQAPSVEWDVSDGMYGFMDRLDEWLRKGALGELNPTGMPLHPPVTYHATRKMVIPRIDTPAVTDRPWFGLAQLKIVTEDRVDVVGWSPMPAPEIVTPAAAAILLNAPMPFEFPGNLRDLLRELVDRAVPRDLLLRILQLAVLRNPKETPLYVLLGAPMRGTAGEANLKQHLTAWYIDPVMADLLRISTETYADYDPLQKIGAQAEEIIWNWAEQAAVGWCTVREQRPEVTIRRDHNSPMAWFFGKTVAVWGCGALGGHVAEYLTRCGISKIILRDAAAVAPGILVRQPYEDAVIGEMKASALAKRLQRIRPDLTVETHFVNLLRHLDDESWTDNVDVILETTGNRAIHTKLEWRRTTKAFDVSVASLMVSHQAERGLAAIAPAAHTGGPLDVIRRAKLETCNRDQARAYRDAFWPEEIQTFQPEPGCSEPTFIGSAADLASMAGMLLNLVAKSLASNEPIATGCFISQPYVAEPALASFVWDADFVLKDLHTGYEIRVTRESWRELQAWIARSERASDRENETGGLLFGERDDATKTIWVSEVSGPPPDSKASPMYFQCGISGMAALNAEKKKRSKRSIQYVGMWHTHPDSLPVPSPTDLEGMEQIVNATGGTPSRPLLLIVGQTDSGPAVGAYVIAKSEIEAIKTRRYNRMCSLFRPPAKAVTPRKLGLALSGGGSRAIAFHLGCLRALQDRGLLAQVSVLSCVSGGSLIGAMYAYRNESFTDFDGRVVELLRKGLAGKILKRTLMPHRAAAMAATIATAGLAATGADLLRGGLSLISSEDSIKRIQPPLRRWISATTMFRDVLQHEIFGDTFLTAARRNGMDVILNACELRTGSAFRFGSKESRCWRFGTLALNDVSVAEAVAASAAYPVFLPALDRVFTFKKRDGSLFEQRVLLTDGGVYDNLGVTPLEPGRAEEFNTAYDLDYIVACNAGQGLFSEEPIPYLWSSRIIRAFDSTFRKAQDGTVKRLHEYAQQRRIKGFVLSYLGQQDQALPWTPTDLVPRSAVATVPTDFSAMKLETIHTLALRGEQLTRLLIDRYCPEL